MADITNDKGILAGQPTGKTRAPETGEGDEAAEVNLDREAEKSATRASDTTKKYDRDHDIFTK